MKAELEGLTDLHIGEPDTMSGKIPIGEGLLTITQG
jgi:hypothetical protein